MEQLSLPALLGRLDGPSVAPVSLVSIPKSYREAVRLSWQLRRVKALTRRGLAEQAGLYAPHVSDYLHADDAPQRRDLPACAIARFSAVVGNSLVSQWLAAQDRLTVLEELQAGRVVAVG